MRINGYVGDAIKKKWVKIGATRGVKRKRWLKKIRKKSRRTRRGRRSRRKRRRRTYCRNYFIW